MNEQGVVRITSCPSFISERCVDYYSSTNLSASEAARPQIQRFNESKKKWSNFFCGQNFVCQLLKVDDLSQQFRIYGTVNFKYGSVHVIQAFGFNLLSPHPSRNINRVSLDSMSDFVKLLTNDARIKYTSRSNYPLVV